MTKSFKQSMIIVALAASLIPLSGFPAQVSKENICVLQTSLGTMVFKFFEADAPRTVNQFQQLVRDGFYDGKNFYRVVKGHVIQAGGGGAPKLPPEFNEHPHLVGTVGLGRDEDINSGDSEFYICVAPRPHLDGKYTVFGQLIEGYNVLEKISNVDVDEKWEGPSKKLAMHKPKEPVIIEKAWIEERPPSAPADEIHDAIRSSDLEKVKTVLQSHPGWLNSPDQNQKTPLHLALESGHIDIAKYLIEKGADINLKDKDKAAPLHNAAYLGSLEIVDLLLKKGAAALNEGNHRGQTPLHFACERGYPEVAARILEAGADIEARDMLGRTPLMTTGISKNIEVAKLLIKRGANINAEAKRGPAAYTTLTVAAMYGFEDLVDLLIDKGAAISKDTLETTLGLAVQGGHPRLFGYVRKNGLDLASLKEKDPGLVFPAAAGGSVEIMKTLLDHGFALDQKDRDGWTPLHIAAVEGNIEMLEFLIKHDLNKDARNMKGETAYHVALAAESVEAADFLKRTGIDTSAPRFPELKGPYMGQKPPGDKPERFLPGIVSAHYNAHSPIVFSPDGKEAQWTEMSPPEGRVMGMKMVVDTWTYPEPVFEGRDSSFSPDGRRVYFIRLRPFREGEKPAGELDGWECYWYMERTPSGWSEPVSVGEAVNSIGVHWQLSVDQDGHLYFSEFEKNIYRSEYKDGEYRKPVKITELFKNDTLQGRSPFISPEADYLLFSSEDKLHVSFKRKDGSWTDKISLGDEINTQGLNSSPRVSPDGKYIFFVSAGGGRLWGIYWASADIIDRLRKEHLKDD